jgi:hypothetical protein
LAIQRWIGERSLAFPLSMILSNCLRLAARLIRIHQISENGLEFLARNILTRGASDYRQDLIICGHALR